MAKQPSRFVWRELMTNDVGKAVQFYTRLFGWKTEEMDMGNMKYTIVKSGDEQVGGIYATPPQAKGTPPHWLGYVSVENVDASCEKAVGLGAKLLSPPMDIPNVGRFAVVADPQGAAVAPFRGTTEKAERTGGKTPVGQWCFDELMTRDTAGAKRFYTQLFGWSTVEHDMGPMGVYTLFKKPGTENDRQSPGLGGMMQLPKDAPAPPHWLHYVEQNDIDVTVKKARELGAKVFVEPMDIPNIGRFAVLADPTGATFAIFKTMH